MPKWNDRQIEQQNEVVGKPCKLAGAPAKVTRNREGYAMIAPLDPSKGSVPYSWIAVFNILENHGGKFD